MLVAVFTATLLIDQSAAARGTDGRSPNNTGIRNDATLAWRMEETRSTNAYDDGAPVCAPSGVSLMSRRMPGGMSAMRRESWRKSHARARVQRGCGRRRRGSLGVAFGRCTFRFPRVRGRGAGSDVSGLRKETADSSFLGISGGRHGELGRGEGCTACRGRVCGREHKETAWRWIQCLKRRCLCS